MADPFYVTRSSSNARVAGAKGLAAPGIRGILEEDQQPGAFEQFFRFLGRPGFAARSALSGDAEGAGRNVLQFLNEIFTVGGVVNPNLTVTGILGGPTDLTEKQHRPEFSDLMERWGGAPAASYGPWEKLGVDIVGGFLTDPLSLVGGGAKGIAKGAFAKGTSRAARQAIAYKGLSEGGDAALQGQLVRHVDAAIQQAISVLTPRAMRAARTTFKGNVKGYEAQTRLLNALRSVNASTLPSLLDNAAALGLEPVRAARTIRAIQGRAAEKLFFDLAAQEGVNLAGAARTFVPTGNHLDEVAAFLDANNPKQLLSVPDGTPVHADILARRRLGDLMELPISEQGSRARLFFRPENEPQAEALARLTRQFNKTADPAERSRLSIEIGRHYGYSDNAIQSYLQAQGLPGTVRTAQQWTRFLDEIPSEVLDEGIMALRKRGLKPGEGLTYFTPWEGWKYDGWEKLFRLTAPGVATALASKVAGSGGILGSIGGSIESMSGLTKVWTEHLLTWAKNKFYDRFSATPGIDRRLPALARKATYTAHRLVQEHRDAAERVFSKFNDAERAEFGRILDQAADTYRARLSQLPPVYMPLGRGGALDRLANLPQSPIREVAQAQSYARELLSTIGGGDPAQLQRLWAAYANPKRSVAQVTDHLNRTLLAGDVLQDVLAQWKALTPGRELEVDEAMKLWRSAMGSIPGYMRYQAKWADDLKNFNPAAKAAWKDALDDPFYVPHQLTRRGWELIDHGLTDRGTAGKINDVFSRARTYQSTAQFLQAIEGRANEVGLALGTDELVNSDIADLFIRRMASFELTKARQSLYQDAARIRSTAGKGATRAGDYEFYINRVLRPMARLDPVTGKILDQGERSTFTKLFGGGTFRFPSPPGTTAQKFAQNFALWKGRVAADGKVEIHFPGINALWKPLLTSHPANVKFRVRNVLSSALMSMFLPEVGYEGFKQIWKAIRNDGFARFVLGPGGYTKKVLEESVSKGDYLTAVTRYITGSTVAEREAARNVLINSGQRVGNYTWSEVLPAMRQILGGAPITPADLSAGQDILSRLLPETAALNQTTRGTGAGARVADLWRRYVKWGEDLSNEIEVRFRATSMLGLMAKGVDPVTAAERVTKAFVDYSRQSSVERALRDTFPFARFMIGSIGWIKPSLERPGVLQTLGAAQRSGGGGEEFLPGEVANTPALPAPWLDAEGNRVFLTSLGVPQEAALQIVAAATSTPGNPEALRKYVGGALHPVLRYPVENITGRNFYFGTDFGGYRKAPFFVPESAATRIPGRDGKPDRFEVPGGVNEFLNMLPTAGVQSTIERFVDARRPLLDKILNAVTGFRSSSVDMDRELKRRLADYLKQKVASGQIGEVQAFFLRESPEDVPEDLKILLQAMAAERSANRRQRGVIR